MKAKLLLSVLIFSAHSLLAQRGKNADLTVSNPGTVLNAYTTLTMNAAQTATSINVASNTLTNAILTTPLAAGDLLLIIQMQGATMDINTTPAAVWGGTYTLSNGAMADLANMNNYRDEWGQVTAYNEAGKYEYAQVTSVSGTNIINLECGLRNNYVSAGKVQVIRVPRFNNLTLAANATVVTPAWNGSTGGVVALEVNGNLVFGNNARISASAFGFRGGTLENSSYGPASGANVVGKPAYSDAGEGAEKGEGIGGHALTEYTALFSRYGNGSPANGGGGGNYRNAGGGGGSNVGSGTYTGYGVPNPAFATAWNQELFGMSSAPSSGGGRGGYSLAQSDQNENTLGPGQSAWGGDFRRSEGGFGGHPLAYDPTRLFMGGGGGAGEQDGNQGGAGGNGGGIVFLQHYGTISGTGTIEARGQKGQNSNPGNQAPNGLNSANHRRGNDGAGGGGAGGSIFISNANPLPNTLTLDVTGGNGGHDTLAFLSALTTPAECQGPGGGGAGGFVNFTSGTPTLALAGGANGIVKTATNPVNIVTNFPPNGATSGAAGTSLTTVPYFDIQVANATICSGQSASLTATILGTQPAGSTITWYTTQFGTTVAGTGTTFTTPSLTATTTYYVGVCPGTFRIPVTVTVGGPTISGTAVVNNATCTTGGSITGLSASGGGAPLTITWNGVTTPTMSLSNASPGTYTVVVTDNVGCTATSGPFTIGSTGGPSVNTTNIVVTNANCLGNNGSISGITASGTGLTYSWNGGAYNTLDISGLAAGSYSLVVTDNLGCTANAGPITIGSIPGPSINTASMVVTNTSCGLSNGSISGITASGSGLTVTWNGATSPLDITSLAAGNYNLLVTDNLGCTANFGPVTIAASTAPTLLTAGVLVTDTHCGLSQGDITGMGISGGTNPMTISWNGGAYTTLDIIDAPAGTYNLSVTDANGCTATAGPYTINDLPGPTIDATNVVIQNESCAGNDGSITGITTTGTVMVFNWNGTNTTSTDLLFASAGTYGLVVTDAFGCTAVAGPFVVGGATPMSLDSANLVITPAGCTVATGAIQGLQVVGGINPVISWSNGPQTANNTNLAAGSYTITVTDDQGCSLTASFSVPTVSGLSVSTVNAIITPEYCNQQNGTVSGVTVTGGTAPYSYLWDGNNTLSTLDISIFDAGTHTVVVTDALGCTASGSISVGAETGPTVDTTLMQLTHATCEQANGSITGIQVSGNGPFTYAWSNTAQTTLDLVNLGAGSYNLLVVDAHQCTSTGITVTVNNSGLVLADFTYSSGVLIPGTAISFVDGSTGGTVVAWQWNIDTLGTVGTTSSVQYTFGTEGVYPVTLIVSSAEGCIDSITKWITISGELIIPNIVTNNGDGANDFFEIKNLKPNSTLIIQNRWGEVVFTTEDYANNWKGTDQSGTELAEGVYFYQLLTVDGKAWQGFIHLINK